MVIPDVIGAHANNDNSVFTLDYNESPSPSCFLTFPLYTKTIGVCCGIWSVMAGLLMISIIDSCLSDGSPGAVSSCSCHNTLYAFVGAM